MSWPSLALLALFSVAAAAADVRSPRSKTPLKAGDSVTLLLNEGKKVSGVFQSEEQGTIWLGVDNGQVGIERALVIGIQRTPNDDGEFLRRRAALAPDDVDGHWKLAEWAKSKGLESSALTEAEFVVALSSQHTSARAMLGHSWVDGKWMAHDDAMTKLDFVEYKGTWIKRAELEEIQRANSRKDKISRLRMRRKELFGGGSP